MKVRTRLCILLFAISQSIASQQTPEPAHRMVEFQMALLKRGPQWTAAETPEGKKNSR